LQQERFHDHTAVGEPPGRLAVGPPAIPHFAKRPPRTDLIWVGFWMTCTLLSFSVAALSVRALASVLSVFEIMTIRTASGLAIMVALIMVRPELRACLAPRRMMLHVPRNSIQFLGQIAWMKAVMLLPFATVFALEFTMPAWVALLAALFLGERLSTSRIGTVTLCFVGVLIIVQPGSASFQPASLLALGSALSFAIVVVITKKLTVTETTLAILFWMNAMQLPVNLALSDPFFVLKLDSSLILPGLGIAISGLAAQYCFTNAFRHGDATLVVPLDFLRVPLIALVGWAFYGEPLSGIIFLGAALIGAGVIWGLHAESRRM
jgi:drug/metabolite transporter (DMT)-like permease